MQTIDSAIILGKNQVKNNNHVVKVFTRKNGIQAMYVSQAAKKKSVKSAVLQPLSICQIEYSSSKNTTLPKLKEAKIEIPLLNIHMDVFKTAIALFTADLLIKVLPHEGETRLYDFIDNSIQILNEIEEGKSNYHLFFLVKMTKWLGIQPTLKKESCVVFDLKEGVFLAQKPNHPHYLSKEETNIFYQLLVLEWTKIGTLLIKSVMRRKLLNSLIQYYIFHVPGFSKPKALTILEEVFD